MILITPKINPDLDGVSCAYALAKVLNASDPDNEYVAGIFGKPQSEVSFLLEKYNLKSGLTFNPVDPFEKFILVDASDLKGMPEVIRSEDVVEVIDHRAVHNAFELFPNAKVQIEPVGAAATLVLEKALAENFFLDIGSLALLYGAIYSNTLNLQLTIATDRDLEVVAYCRKQAREAISDSLIEEMFRHKTKDISENLAEVIASDFKGFVGGTGIAQLEGYDLEILINERLGEIKEILACQKVKNALDRVFLTACDINRGYNIFVALEPETEMMLAKALNVSFDNNGVAKNDKLILRKQILPLLG
ncbi:MAG: DHH family phosphoesterase [Patescibacteria group bacterium]